MKILIIPSWYVSEKHPDSGIYFRQLAISLQEAGHDVGVIFVNNHFGNWREKVKKRQFFTKKTFVNDTIPTFRLDVLGLPLRWAFIQKKYAQRVLECYEMFVAQYGQPDILHAHGYMAAYASTFIQTKSGIPLVYTEHSTYFKNQDFPVSHLPMIKIAAENAKGITSVSSALKEWMKQNNMYNVKVIPNLTDTNLFKLEEKNKHNIFTFLFVGDINAQKSVDILLDAFNLLKKETNPEIQLLLVGSGSLKKSLEKWVRHHDLEKNIQFLGLLTDKNVAQQMQKAHCLVLSSNIETFGVVLIEAMACGLPVIATDCGGTSDVVSNETGVLVPKNDVLAFSNAMQNVLSNINDWDATKIRNYSIQNFGNEAVVIKWVNYYKSILA
jgi:glycosyltransferase involved in cell wall biosynthesis